MARRRFTDNAGYTRHCWECRSAEFARDNAMGFCFTHMDSVYKYDSPNNPYSDANGCVNYDPPGGRREENG